MTIHFSDEFSPGMRRLLENTQWGSGGILYRVRHYDRALWRLPNPQFATIGNRDQPIAHATYFEKTVHVHQHVCQTVYLTHLSVAPDHRGLGLAGELVRAIVQRALSRRSSDRPLLVTAYVEAANAPSFAVFRRQRFQIVGSFDATVFNRVHPRPLPGVSPLRMEEEQAFRSRLMNFYSDHAFTDFDGSVQTEEVRVLRSNEGDWRAALQFHPEEWEVTQMDGLSGRLVLQGLCRIPWVKRHLFNPESSRFIHLSQAWCTPGGEKDLLRLVEDTLLHEQVPFAVAYWDPTSAWIQRLKAAGSFGLLNAVMRTPVQVLAWSDGLTAESLAQLRTTPLYISPLDI